MSNGAERGKVGMINGAERGKVNWGLETAHGCPSR